MYVHRIRRVYTAYLSGGILCKILVLVFTARISQYSEIAHYTNSCLIIMQNYLLWQPVCMCVCIVHVFSQNARGFKRQCKGVCVHDLPTCIKKMTIFLTPFQSCDLPHILVATKRHDLTLKVVYTCRRRNRWSVCAYSTVRLVFPLPAYSKICNTRNA